MHSAILHLTGPWNCHLTLKGPPQHHGHSSGHYAHAQAGNDVALRWDEVPLAEVGLQEGPIGTVHEQGAVVQNVDEGALAAAVHADFPWKF